MPRSNPAAAFRLKAPSPRETARCESAARAWSRRASQLKLSGSNFLAANIPGARVTMAPDLALAGKSGSLALTGMVKIEDADVNLEKLSFARSYRAPRPTWWSSIAR